MPIYKIPEKTLSKRLVMLLLSLAVIAAVLFFGVEALAVAAVLLILVLWERRKGLRQAQFLSSSREGEGICEFARSANCRVNDPWIVRAVYEELIRTVSVSGCTVPIRWDDRIEEDLGIDPEDLDMDIAMIIAQRTGRSLVKTEDNPLHGKVRTAGDLVAFFNAQPSRAET